MSLLDNLSFRDETDEMGERNGTFSLFDRRSFDEMVRIVDYIVSILGWLAISHFYRTTCVYLTKISHSPVDFFEKNLYTIDMNTGA